MPIYEYECPTHGVFEIIQKMSDRPLKKCEQCGKAVHKVVSQSNFALKGGGWYKDLYGSTKKGGSDGEAIPNPKSEKGGEKSAEKTSEKSGEKSSEKSSEKSEPRADKKSEPKAEKSEPKPSSKPDNSKPDKPTKSKASSSAAA